MLQVLTFLTKQRNFATLASESLEIKDKKKDKTRLLCEADILPLDTGDGLRSPLWSGISRVTGPGCDEAFLSQHWGSTPWVIDVWPFSQPWLRFRT